MTTLWARVAGAWNRFWFAEVDGLPLGLARVGIALGSFGSWVGTAPLLRQYYSDLGEFPIEGARTWSVEYAARFLMPDVLGAYPVVVVLFALWGIAMAALLVGWRTRAAAWAHWVLYLWFFLRNPTFANGGDEVLRLTSLYLALAYTVLPPAQRALSLDRRRHLAGGGGGAATRNPAWTVRMIQVQISIVYVVAGFWKVIAPPWMDGTALAYALGNPSFSRFGMPDWAWLQPLFVLLTISVAWWEFLFPLLAAGRRTRLPSLAFGVALHLGILVFMYVGVFPFIMLGCYPAFLKGHEARWVVEKVGGLVGVPGQASEARRVSAPSDVAS